MEKYSDITKNLNLEKMQSFYPKSEFAKMVTKLPILTWRLGLGPIAGRLFMIITHTGRKTGNPHQTMVEYHTMNGIKYVVCAFGVKTQWYRNIMADPRVTIQTSDGTEHMVAVRVTQDDELISVFNLMMRKDPPIMNWYIQSLGVKPEQESILSHKQDLVFLRFDPTSEPTPPGLEVDLAWIWPLFLVWLVISKPFRRRK